MTFAKDAKESAAPGPRLSIVCGLPGAGKTTLARALERRLGVLRFRADEWMAALALNHYDEKSRARRPCSGDGPDAIGAGSRGDHRMGYLGQVRAGYLAPGSSGSGRRRARLCFRARGGSFRPGFAGTRKSAHSTADLDRWIAIFQVPTPEEMALFEPPLIADAASG
jgi:hypothetical protein